MFSWGARVIAGAVIGILPMWVAADVDELDIAIFDALRQSEIIEVMREEGIASGRDGAGRMFAPSALSKWGQALEAVYDTEVMTARALAAFSDSLAGADREAVLAFFTTDPGRTLVALEVSGRRALLDQDVTDSALEQGRAVIDQGGARAELITQFMQENDLVERNVAGNLNSMLAFYVGLQGGGGLPDEVSLEVILEDLISQEANLRAETSNWMFAYLYLSYNPVSDEDLAAYIAFSKTRAGQRLNRALFDAYEELFNDISHVLGREAARIMVQSEL